MHIDRTKINFMPLIRGPLWDQKSLPRHVYASVESLLLQYETDPDAIPPLLPEPFRPGKSPTVSVLFNDNNGVDFMAGGGYRLAAISVAAQFDGEMGHLDGDYVLVMPEDSTLPILSGREWLGMPKIFADISSIRIMNDGHLRCEAFLVGPPALRDRHHSTAQRAECADTQGRQRPVDQGAQLRIQVHCLTRRAAGR